MFDIRYHIVSIVAVFLALTIGLLLGSLIVDKGILARQQERLVESIKADVNSVLQQNKLLQEEVNQLKTFQEEVLGVAVKDKLPQRKVGVISFSSDQSSLYAKIADTLNQSGAKSTHIIISLKDLDFGNKQLVENLAASFNAQIPEDQAFEKIFWQRLAQEIAGKEGVALLASLKSSNLLKIEGEDILPVDSVLLIAPPSKERSKNEGNRDHLLLDALRQFPELTVVGAETTDLNPSRIGAYQLLNVSTVDNIESIPGQISLVYLLQKKEIKANFGVKPTADRLLP